ncbi:DUF3050 domain-containing protein [Maribacter sp. SA7]|uniref:DUF3050 domain-containing protein n=1 Tax=Maribacter zhoushanensis TaxID=3030012 RepID=UPI0023EE271F|nr:DUF3050 domain-containing protein [Maribacter zhoushanensis]MDF4201626.1 DUF3050 domain-containing protein [Maribacter zhoushanensis]
MRIEEIEHLLEPLRDELRNHQLYNELNSVSDIRIFMESHVYAVWDFMSLLKALQINLTCTTLPWRPVSNTNTARFINEIVLEEETDVNELGVLKSHYEMYLDAMVEVGADTTEITDFLTSIENLDSVLETIESIELNAAVKSFLNFTFETIKTQQPHKIAAAFTFGREDLIPDMFLKIVDQAGEDAYPKLEYYLRRHIELDGDDHGPLSLKMIQELCGEDEAKWHDVLECSEKALQQRIHLWDHIAEAIQKNKEITV